MPTENKKYPNDNGRKLFHPMYINWSYLYLGKVARVTIKNMTPSTTFKLNHMLPGNKTKGNIVTIGSQPPKNSVDTKALIKSILAYSPKKNKAKVIAEYSTLYPETSSASASGKSKGCRFVSASIDTQNKINIGNKGIKNQISFWASTIVLKLKDPAQIHTLIMINPIETS